MDEIQRDELPVDVLFVGAGPANLLGAWHLMRLMKTHNADIEKGVKKGTPFDLDNMTIMVIEKGSEVGAHNFSGAVLDPKAIQEIMPDWLERGAPVEGKVDFDAVMFLTEGGAFKLPITPPPLVNHGNYVISLSKICRWLGKLCEEEGVQVYPSFPGTKVLFDGKRVKGVQTGDKGLDPDGNPKDNFEPGILITSKVTVFGEGPRGHLVRQLEQELGISKGKTPQIYEMGVKEIFELPEGHGRFKAGDVWHTMGYPLPNHTFGGGFIYGMTENRLAVGLVVDLHSPDPYLDAHRELQKLKANPWVSQMIEGGKVVQYGGKATPSVASTPCPSSRWKAA
ncbi:MAG: NAD(P)/FAD-dependent oxidoreductase [Myxococcota bacterium]